MGAFGNFIRSLGIATGSIDPRDRLTRLLDLHKDAYALVTESIARIEKTIDQFRVLSPAASPTVVEASVEMIRVLEGKLFQYRKLLLPLREHINLIMILKGAEAIEDAVLDDQTLEAIQKLLSEEIVTES